MKRNTKYMNQIQITGIFVLVTLLTACKSDKSDYEDEIRILFLHHSVGHDIWNGKSITFIEKVANKIIPKVRHIVAPKPKLPKLVRNHNSKQNTNYTIEEQAFPKRSPYGWTNYPFDYYNIWVKNAGDKTFLDEPTLEILTKEYDVIVFKHCFPVSNIQADRDSADINSDYKSLANYKLQYLALRDQLNEYASIKFMIFTGATPVKTQISQEEALRAKEFFTWVLNEWDQPNDNIFIWDLYSLQTEGELYFKDEYAVSNTDSHPNGRFASKCAKMLYNRLIDVIEFEGLGTNNKGEHK